MPRGALSLALIALAVAAAADAHPLGTTSVYPQPCVTVDGPEWTQTINLTAHQAPPKTAHLRVLHGRRYFVFVGHVPCAWAKRNVTALISRRTVADVQDASPAHFGCRAGSKRWFTDPFNGDAVRHSQPLSSIGLCSTQKTDAVPGVTYRAFWWSPAKPCRPNFKTETCRG
jgi:hypothetical protein